MTTQSSLPKQFAPGAEKLSPPKIHLSGKTTASELLAAFSPKGQRKAEPQPWVSPLRFPITMSDKRPTRRKERVTYQISDDSDSLESPSAAGSTFSTPQKSHRGKFMEYEEEEEESEIEPAKTPAPRLSSAGHSLRQHQDINRSLRAQENADKPRIKRRKISKKTSRKSNVILDEEAITLPKTARNEIRNEIATETARRRGSFFVAKKDYFLPLLPDKNHITRLVEERSKTKEGEKYLSVPYEALKHQPIGYA